MGGEGPCMTNCGRLNNASPWNGHALVSRTRTFYFTWQKGLSRFRDVKITDWKIRRTIGNVVTEARGYSKVKKGPGDNVHPGGL